jgi:prepilin-type N-terminal cleavage/methylation domain-containing protein
MMTRPTRMPTSRTGSDRRAGFTLIELMAVVAIMAMMFALGIPRLARSPWKPLEEEAEQIAQTLRFARQRAIMTGVPHRLLIDLEEGGYTIEWLAEQEALDGGDGLAGFAALLSGGGMDALDSAEERPSLDFVPRRRAEREYHPIPHSRMGVFRWLDEAHYFVGVDGPGGWVESGDYAIVFAADGTTDSILLTLADAQDHRLVLEIEPLLQSVRMLREGVDA